MRELKTSLNFFDPNGLQPVFFLYLKFFICLCCTQLSTESAVTNQQLVVLNVASTFHNKLSPWKAQWDALLIAYGIYGYVNDIISCRDPFLPVSNPTFSSSPQPKDKFILDALLASINSDISLLVSSAKTSPDV